MKQAGKLFLASLLGIMLVMPLVMAAAWGANLDPKQWAFNFLFGTTEVPTIVVIMVWIVLFVGISDLITGITPFSNWVCWVIGFATTVIAAQVGFIIGMSVWLNTIFAGLGALAVYAILIISILALFGFSWAYTFLIQMKARKQEMQGKITANKVSNSIRNLKKIQEAGFEK
jgi:hypothetical protein